jgi:hypothetical protein
MLWSFLHESFFWTVVFSSASPRPELADSRRQLLPGLNYTRNGGDEKDTGIQHAYLDS